MARPFFLLAVSGLAGTIALIASTDPAGTTAFNYPWCANYNMQNGAKNCGFTTLEQCQATVSGIGGYCGRNPRYSHRAKKRY